MLEYVNHIHADARGGQKRELEPLELELGVALGTRPGFLEEEKVFIIAESSLQLQLVPIIKRIIQI